MNEEMICGECGEALCCDEAEFPVGCPGCGADRERLYPADDTN